MIRSWPSPPGGRTLHLIGDTHFGAITTIRSNKVLADLVGSMVPTPAAHVQVGDSVNLGQSSEDVTALAWLTQLDAPYYLGVGNHDVYPVAQGGSGRTVAQWAAAWGYSSQNRTVELEFAKLIFIGPDAQAGDGAQMSALPQATLDWLDDELAEANRPCLIVCHWPLKDTVVGDTGVVYSSAESSFYARGPNGIDDTEIRAVLSGRWQAKAWISGHTHSPLSAPGFVKLEDVGGRDVVSVNCSALYFVGRSLETFDPLVTLYLTVYSDRLEVRFRDHGAGAWAAVGDDRVVTVRMPA